MKKILICFFIMVCKLLICKEIVFTNEDYKNKWYIVKLKNAIDGKIEVCKEKSITKNGEVVLKFFYKISDKPGYNVIDYRRKIDRNIDWKKMKKVSFSIYGNKDENIYLQVGFYTSSGSYFIMDIKEINWSGWKRFEIFKKDLNPVGNLCDWDDIDSFFIRVNGDVAASKNKIKNEDSGEIYINSIIISQ